MKVCRLVRWRRPSRQKHAARLRSGILIWNLRGKKAWNASGLAISRSPVWKNIHLLQKALPMAFHELTNRKKSLRALDRYVWLPRGRKSASPPPPRTPWVEWGRRGATAAGKGNAVSTGSAVIFGRNVRRGAF